MQLECYIPLFLGLYNVFFTFQVIGGLVLEEEIKFPVSIFRGICHQYGRHYFESIHNLIFELSVENKYL